MTAKVVSEKLGCNSKYVQKSKGVFRYHLSYYWGMTKDASKLEEKVMNTFPNAVIEQSGNHYHEFVGGAESGSAKDSFLWVKFTLPE